jgi:hypothetical protein
MENFISGASRIRRPTQAANQEQVIRLARSTFVKRWQKALGLKRPLSSLTRYDTSSPVPPHVQGFPVQFLEHFFGEKDAIFFKSLGLNCIRIAVGYRHFDGTVFQIGAQKRMLKRQHRRR